MGAHDLRKAVGSTPLDGKLTVDDEPAFETARRLAVPDRGDRYLSTALFRSVCAGCPR